MVGGGIAKTFILSFYAHHDTASQPPYCILHSVFSTEDIYIHGRVAHPGHVAGDDC